MKKSSNDLTHLVFLHADQHCVAIHKSPGIPCQSKSPGPHRPLDRSVENYLNEPVRLWTRIDQPVSGIVLFYRNLPQHAQGHSRILNKTYYALVEGHPPSEQTLVSHLRRDGQKRKSLEDPKNGKRAELTYSVVQEFDHYSLLRITPKTGRFHQIRHQLAHIGFPVKGDVKYGARRKNKDRSIHLHAFQYAVQHGDQPPISIMDYALLDDPLWDISRPYMNHAPDQFIIEN